MDTKILFNELATITERNLQVLKTKFQKLSANQLNWKSSELNWSINEIFAHLNAYSSFYNRVFHEKIDSTKHTKPKQTFTSSPLGKSAWISMRLGKARNVKRKFNAPKNFNPTETPALCEGNQLERWIVLNEDFLTIIEKSVSVSLRRVKIPLSLSNLIKLRLGDALLFVAYHSDRHMEQAINVSKHPNFPRK